MCGGGIIDNNPVETEHFYASFTFKFGLQPEASVRGIQIAVIASLLLMISINI